MSSTCPFCHPNPEQVFFEGQLVCALWDKFPVTPGHALIITRRHVASWFDATPDEQAELHSATEAVKQIIEARHDVDGYNLGINVGTAAGQTVPHLHLHIIPRRTWDVPDPRGGVRGVIPELGNYLATEERGGSVHESTMETDAVLEPPGRPALIGGPEDPLLPHLISHLDSAVRAELLVAFILESGVDALEPALRGFLLRGGRLRILTGDYLNVTDPRALSRLLDLVNYSRASGGDSHEQQVELRVYQSSGSSFHPKSYIFHFTETPVPYGESPRGIAYIGSSNLSRTALGDGVEWNYSLVIGQDRVGFQRVTSSFEGLFHDEHTRPLTQAWIEEYRKRRPALAPPALEVAIEAGELPPDPHAIQLEALAALEATREQGNRTGLVVMATGLGKTWLAAFDVARLSSRRVLFVAHRDEILRQALQTFRRILPEASLGLYTGQEKVPDADVLFASIQSLGRSKHLAAFAPSAFGYVVIDEFHHASARTYRRLIDHFTPDFLLGLTATPERMDGGNILSLCAENLVYRCDLFDGIRRAPDRLVPFHYFGVPDEVDYANIPWRNHRFDPEALTTHVATRERASNALEEWRKRAGRRTLGFCCSRAHADLMAEHFRENGVRAVAVHSGPTSAPRATSLGEFARGDLEVLFAVDILNEGIDIPSIDTILMLRPTESSIVFLQQLGRGLRANEGKEYLTVVDYIGNHRSFLLKPRMLLQLAPGEQPTREALHALTMGNLDQLDLPPGCEVTYELAAIDLLRDQLRSPTVSDAMHSWYADFEERTGRRPLALDAYHEAHDPRSARPSNGSWLRFVAARGGLPAQALAFLDNDELSGAFLDELERTSMSRSFKMLLLLAMMRAGCFPGSIDIVELSQRFAELAERSARLQAEVTVDMRDPDHLRSYLERNPIAAWCKPQGRGAPCNTYFRYSEGTFATTFAVSEEEAEVYSTLVHELAEWRIAAHLGPS